MLAFDADAASARGVVPFEQLLAGAGGVGSLAIQLAKWKGLTVFTTASQPQHMEMAQQLGADHVINYKEVNFVDIVQ